MAGEGEMMLGLEPAVIGAAELVERSEFDHLRNSLGWTVVAP
jgi:hypothetical protein